MYGVLRLLAGLRPLILILTAVFAGLISAQVAGFIPTKISKLLDTRYPGWKLPSIPEDKSKACYLGAMEADLALDRKARTPAGLFFISGDFDGDGRLDHAASIVHSRRNLVIVFLDRQPAPKLIVLEKGELGEAISGFLSLYPKGSARFRDELGEHPFARDTVGVYRCASAMSPEGMEYHPDLFVYQGGMFRKEDWVPARNPQ